MLIGGKHGVEYASCVRVFGKLQNPKLEPTPLFKCNADEASKLVRAGNAEVFREFSGGRKIRALRILINPRDVNCPRPAPQKPADIAQAMATSASRWAAERAKREADADGAHSEFEWQQVLNTFGNQCVRCGSHAEQTRFLKLTKDHVVPLASGGSDFASNLQPLCQSCNSWKGNRYIDFRTSCAVA